jgi:hypothetical protein
MQRRESSQKGNPRQARPKKFQYANEALAALLTLSRLASSFYGCFYSRNVNRFVWSTFMARVALEPSITQEMLISLAPADPYALVPSPWAGLSGRKAGLLNAWGH